MTRIKLLILFSIILLFPSQILFSQGFLHRNGKYIYDGSGDEVILKGIGTGNWMIQEGYMMQSSDVAGSHHEFREKLVGTIGEEKTDSFYITWLDSHFRKIDVDSMSSWGFNSVRVAMHYKWFTPPIEDEPVLGQITWIEKGFEIIDSLLSWCGDNKMYLILDLHGAPGGQGKEASISDYDNSKPSLWESNHNKDKTIALWRKLAERYSLEPWIGGYDLINETNWTFPQGNNSMLKDLMVDITSAIREVDQNHIIFIEGNGFANDFSGLKPPWDDNMVYSFHKYWNYNTRESINFALNLRNSYNVPIWLGETGENSNTWFTNLITLCEKNRIGWSWWPVKKPGINNPLKVEVNSDYSRLINYWKGDASNPGVDAAFNAVLKFADNHRLENCSFQKDVVDAMIRQPKTTETIPYKLYNTNEPIFAVDYNLGRNGYAYYDNDTANFHGSTNVFTNWNEGWSYRNDGVDIQKCTDNYANIGFNVGWTGEDEWLEYTVNVDSAAGYTMEIRSASDSGSGASKVHLEMDGKVLTPLISLPRTSGWQTWRTTSIPEIILPNGVHKIRLKFEKGGSNLNFFKFINPVSIDSLEFKNLFAETSSDGSSVYLTLNKTVTSDVERVDLNDFLLSINDSALTINEVKLSETDNRKLIINIDEKLFFGGNINIDYVGDSILSSGQILKEFSNLTVINRLPYRKTLPGRIQSEDYSFNRGMVSESCSDTGGGLDMGYASPGDYLDYPVYIPQSRYYKFNFRVASIRASSQLIIRIGEENTFTDVDTLTITSTGGWQTWQTVPVTVFLPEGRYTLRMYVRNGEFNTNWFHVSYASTVNVEIPKMKNFVVYPNPVTDFLNINLKELNVKSGEITVYDNTGKPIKSFNFINQSDFKIQTSDLSKGLYFIVLIADNKLLLTSKFIVR